MHRRIVAVVAAVLYALLAITALVVADLHDRTYPQDLDVAAVVNLDFGPSALTDAQAFSALAHTSDEHDLGLLKVAPDLSGDEGAQVYVRVGDEADVPEVVRRFGDAAPGEVRPRSALEHSYASGEYLVTGSEAAPEVLVRWAEEHQVGARRSDNNVGATFNLLLRQPSFLTSLVAVSSLLVALVLYWLSAKARGRALRTLGGVPAARVHVEDVGGFMAVTSAAALGVLAVASAWVGWSHGWEFAPSYARILLVLSGSALILAGLGALVMSAAASPDPNTLARRTSPVGHLRRASMLLKATTFVVVLLLVGPAVSAWVDARTAAEQVSRWNALSDQVTLWFPGAMGEDGFQEVMGKVGDVVAEADAAGAVALSYAYDPEALAGVDVGSIETVAIVNPQWLALMADPAGRGSMPGLTPVRADEVSEELRAYVEEDLVLWAREGSSPTTPAWYRFASPEAVALATGGSGELTFPRDAFVLVVPDLHAALDDSFLASAATSRNLVFTGLGPTEQLLTKHGLSDRLRVKYAAEEGILLAQFTSYFAWLQGVSLVGLAVSLAVGAVVSAFVVAVLRVRRDHPLRLAGRSWPEILGRRVVVECGVGLVLAGLALTLRGGQQPVLVLGFAVVLLTLSPLAHLFASRWVFARVVARRV